MIAYDLKCGRGHVYEAWFANSEAHERQAKAGQVACPVCGDTRVAKAPMAPHIATRKAGLRPKARPAGEENLRRDGKAMATKGTFEQTSDIWQALQRIRAEVEKNCENVGERFAEEARRIHYGEREQRNIYGETTAEEAQGLKDEGIEFGVLPWPVRKHS